jgi:putative GTP pyrophosphokinase
MEPEDYRKLIRPYRRVLDQLGTDLKYFLEDIGTTAVFVVESRIKTYESAVAKAHRFNKEIRELYDLAGLRVVVGTSADVEIVKRFFEQKSLLKDLTIELDKFASYSTGYRSTHLVLSFPGHYTRSAHSTKVEVQIPTILQHAFNFLSRLWAYKTDADPGKEWQGRFAKLAARLHRLDGDVAALQSGAVSAAAQVGDSPMTPHTYQDVAREVFGEVVDLRSAVDSTRLLYDAGVVTCADLRAFFLHPAIWFVWHRFSELATAGSPFAKTMTSSHVAFWETVGRSSNIESWLNVAEKELAGLSQPAS